MLNGFPFCFSGILVVSAVVLTSNSPSSMAAPGVGSGDLTIDPDQPEIGFGGYYKVGRWTPVTISVTTARPMQVQLSVEVSDPEGSATSLPMATTKLSTTGSHRLRGIFKSGRLDSKIRIRIDAGERMERELRVSADVENGVRRALKQSVLLLATLGKLPGFSDLAEGRAAALSRRSSLRVVQLDGIDELPIGANVYDSLDVLVIAGKYDLDPPRNRAVRDWVRTGGHLVLWVGRNVSGYLKSPLANWVPVPVAEQPMRIRELSGLESFAGTNAPIRFRGSVAAARIGEVEGQVLRKGLYGPLLVRVPYGFGRITFCGIDPDRKPLSQWSALVNLCWKLVANEPNASGSRQHSEGGRLSHSGITDLSTQLHAAQEHFPEIGRFSSWLVMGLMLVYLLVIGPLDYLLVHRLLKRPHLTWCTFPTMVAVAAGLAVWGARTTNGEQLRLNQIDVIDVAEKERTVRTRTWMTVYSPESRRYEVAVEPLDTAWSQNADDGTQTLPPVTPKVSWHGIPEDAFGGMYRRGGFEIGRPGYHFATQASALKDLPVNVWSTRSLTASWSFQTAKLRPLVESTLSSSAVGRLSGKIVHHLPAPLKDWMIGYGNRVYRPISGSPGAELLPGQTWPPDWSSVYQRELKGFLTGTRKKRGGGFRAAEILLERANYDPLGRDPAVIMRMLTFHRAAGGKSYTGLDNNALRELDMSGMLHLDRAVLFGRIDAPVARLVLSGKTVVSRNRHTFVRILLPVKRARVIQRELPSLNDVGR